tara:strand:+ start:299 stop:769 length:471 start_codon:yes stop_codon:yes gene_type:complete
MIRLLYIILFSLIVANCSFNKVVKKHGVRNLEKKQKALVINESNKNDVKSLLGPPSTTSSFDNDLWIFIEREIVNEKLVKLSKEKLIVNNVLIVEIDNRGLLVNKVFYDIDDINNITFSTLKTSKRFKKNTFIYDFLSSMRQKINDPLGKRKTTTD